MTDSTKFHVFTDDVLAHDDACALAQKLQQKTLSSREAVTAALKRIERADPFVHGVETIDAERALTAADAIDRARLKGESLPYFAGVPFMLKDNVRQQGFATNHGSAALNTRPAKKHGEIVDQILSTGLISLGKTVMPEFGLTASAEFSYRAAVANPWNLQYSNGGSSSGAAALCAAGALPIAHGNDGGGSIRLPAAANGLVGLKASRGRHVLDSLHRPLPVKIVCDGVLTRSVRDTAKFFSEAEKYYQNPHLLPIGEIEQPLQRRLKIGYIHHSPLGVSSDAETVAALDKTIELLSSLGHELRPCKLEFDAQMAVDFENYWSFLALMMGRFGKLTMDWHFDHTKLEKFTTDMGKQGMRSALKLPASLIRLRQAAARYQQHFQQLDVILTPVYSCVVPKLGFFGAGQDYTLLRDRLLATISFTPLHNAAGAPAISLPLQQSSQQIPIGQQFCAAIGNERLLLELALELEAAQPFAAIDAA